MTTRIVLADDHKMVREGMRDMLNEYKDLEVAGEAENGRTLLRLVEKVRPHVAITDINMPDLNGIEATRQIHAEFPNVKIIGLSVHMESRFVTEMLKAGASGYLPKKCAFDELVQAIHVVMDGKTYLSPEISDVLVDKHVRTAPEEEGSVFTKLTAREREVLQLISEGHSVKEIAGQLFLSVQTVHTHRQHVMEKLDIHNDAGLIRYAIREGLTSL